MDKLGLDAFSISTQTYPRKLDYIIFSVLGSIALSVYKFGFDVRILQSPQFGILRVKSHKKFVQE